MCILSFKNWKINTLSSKSIQTEKFSSLAKGFLSFLSLYIFEEKVFIFQFLNDEINSYGHNCAFYHSKLKNKHTFLKKSTNWESWESSHLTEREERKTRYFPPYTVFTLLSHKKLILQSQILFSSQSCFALHNKSFLFLHKSTTCCTTFLSWHFLTHSSFVKMNFWKENYTNHGFQKNHFNLLEKSVPNFWILNDGLPNSWNLNDGLHLKVNHIWY